MKREEKTAVVTELASKLSDAEAIFAVDYKGISVPQAAELRTRLRESDAVFTVVKNRLAKRAAEQAGTDGLDDLLSGPIALTLIKGDPVTVAKTITTFAREHEVLEYRGGLMDGEPLDPESFTAIARLPGREVLHGQLVGLAASPLTGLVAGLSNLISGLGRQLAQIAEQGLVTGEAPAAETPAAEETPEDPPAAEETPEDPPAATEAPEEPPPEEPPSEESQGEEGPDPATETAPEDTSAPEPEEPAEEAPAEEVSETENEEDK